MEELHSNIEVFEEEAHYFDEQTQRPCHKVQFMDEHNHFINDSLHLIQRECPFHEEDHSVNVSNLYKYTSDGINPSEYIICPAMVGSEPLPVDDSEKSNI